MPPGGDDGDGKDGNGGKPRGNSASDSELEDDSVADSSDADSSAATTKKENNAKFVKGWVGRPSRLLVRPQLLNRGAKKEIYRAL